MSSKHILLGAIIAGIVACVPDQPAPTEVEVSVPLFAVGGNSDFNIGTHLSGAEEVFTAPAPTPADSRAQGQAIFRVSDSEDAVSFKLIASNIDNVVMAHIHCGAAGTNGPVSIWLYPVIGTSGGPAAPGAGAHNGVLAQGTFSPAGVICPASAVGQDMPLLDAIRAGLTYVNVHTNDGAGATNTGPGDFLSGEIRGQLDHASGHAKN